LLSSNGAVQASCKGIRIDSNVTTTTVRQARQLLNQLGAEQVKIFVSDGLDEHRVQELAATGCVDGFGVGENILCSPDAATGIGAVGKLVVNGYDQPTMKISKGSGKATLPGLMQVYRYPDHDLCALMDEAAPSGGVPLLEEVWGHSGICSQPTIAESRIRTQQQLAALPRKALSITESYQRTLVLSDALLALVQRLS
jgi:nicotinate phosphoribosyltransferase